MTRLLREASRAALCWPNSLPGVSARSWGLALGQVFTRRSAAHDNCSKDWTIGWTPLRRFGRCGTLGERVGPRRFGAGEVVQGGARGRRRGGARPRGSVHAGRADDHRATPPVPRVDQHRCPSLGLGGGGIVVGSPLHGDTIANHVYLVASGSHKPTFTGSLGLAATNVSANAHVGFAGVSVSDSLASGVAAAARALAAVPFVCSTI